MQTYHIETLDMYTFSNEHTIQANSYEEALAIVQADNADRNPDSIDQLAYLDTTYHDMDEY